MIGKMNLLLCVVLLLTGCSINKETINNEQYQEIDSLDFLIATDIHYLSPQLTDHGSFFQEMFARADGKAEEYCEEIVDAFVTNVIEQKPDGLILSGDLTLNGAKKSHTDLANKLKSIVDQGIPVYVIPGNHDMNQTSAISFEDDGYEIVESIKENEFTQIYKQCGYSSSISNDKTTLSYVTEVTPQLRLLMLDANTNGITEETLRWVEQQLFQAQQKGIRVLAVSHQNLLIHNSQIHEGFVMDNNLKLKELYEKYHVICNLSGHMHIQDIAQSTEGFMDIATESLLVQSLSYAKLHLEGTSGRYTTQEIQGIPDITKEAQNLFWNTSYNQAKDLLVGNQNAEQMATYFANLNDAYFSGRMDTVTYDDPTLKQWQTKKCFLTSYIESIKESENKDSTNITFEFPN